MPSGRSDSFIRKFLAYRCRLILAGEDIDVFFPFLKRFDNTSNIFLSIIEIGTDQVQACRADAHAIATSIPTAIGETLPDSHCFIVSSFFAIFRHVLAGDKGFDPIQKPSQPIPVGMHETFDKCERSVWGYGSGWTGGNAELAIDARIVVDRLIIGVQGCIYDYRSQAKMAAEYWVDKQSMVANQTEACRFCNRFM